MKLKIQKFDPEKMKSHRICLFVGRRGTGKSCLCEDLLFHLHNKVDFGIAMSPTEESAAVFRKHMPDSWVFPGFSAAKLEQMIAMQRATVAQGKPPRSLFLVCDDCTYDKSIFKGKAVRDLYMNGRHSKITFLNCKHTPALPCYYHVLHLSLPASRRYAIRDGHEPGPSKSGGLRVRAQGAALARTHPLLPSLHPLDGAVYHQESIISNKQKLWKFFFGMFEKYDDFSRVMDRVCARAQQHCIPEHVFRTCCLLLTRVWSCDDDATQGH